MQPQLVKIGGPWTRNPCLVLSQYYLELVEGYSEGKIHKSESEPGNGNVNTMYFGNQARGDTRISCTEFVYDERARDYKCFLIFHAGAKSP